MLVLILSFFLMILISSSMACLHLLSSIASSKVKNSLSTKRQNKSFIISVSSCMSWRLLIFLSLSLELPSEDDLHELNDFWRRWSKKLIWCCNFFIIFSKIRKEIIGIFFFFPISRLFFIKFYISAYNNLSIDRIV